MRILMVHNDYAQPSGEEYAVEAIASLLRSEGQDVLWFRRSSAEIAGSMAGQVRAFFSGIYSFSTRCAMTDLLNREHVDVVQVQNLYPLISPAGLVPCRKRGLPVVMRCPNYRLFCPTGLHLHNGHICERCVGNKTWWCVMQNCEGRVMKSLGYALRNATAAFARLITGNVDIFLVLSEFQKRRFVQGGIEESRIEVLPNIVEPKALLDGAAVGETVAFVGRLSPEKGVDDFLAAARALPQYHFAVAGDTSGMPNAVAAAPRNVEFCGFLRGKDLDEFYARARVLVAPSVWFEGFPNTVGSAMGMGKPVIASRLGALPEIVDDGGTGLLFEPGNVGDLVEKIDHLWKRPDLCRQMGEAGHAKVEREYAPRVCYERLMAAYEKAAIVASRRR